MSRKGREGERENSAEWSSARIVRSTQKLRRTDSGRRTPSDGKWLDLMGCVKKNFWGLLVRFLLNSAWTLGRFSHAKRAGERLAQMSIHFHFRRILILATLITVGLPALAALAANAVEEAPDGIALATPDAGGFSLAPDTRTALLLASGLSALAMGRRRREEETEESAPLSDGELIEGVLRNDEKAFNHLYDRYFPRVFDYAKQRLGSGVEAQNVVEEVFLDVFANLQRRTEMPFSGTVLVATSRALSRRWRRCARRLP